MHTSLAKVAMVIMTQFVGVLYLIKSSMYLFIIYYHIGHYYQYVSLSIPLTECDDFSTVLITAVSDLNENPIILC